MNVIRKSDIKELVKDFEKISNRCQEDFMRKISMAREKKNFGKTIFKRGKGGQL